MRKIFSFVFLIGAVLSPLMSAHAQTSGVTAEAIGTANIRATTDTNATLLTVIASGTRYPIVGRSEFYPWVLLADPATLQPIGWAFQDLLTIQGSLNTVPISALVMSDSIANPVSPSLIPPDITPLSLPEITLTPAVIPTQPLAYAVTGTVSGEVYVRYGPGVDYPRLGVTVAGDMFGITAYHAQVPWIEVAYPASPNGKAWILRDLLTIQGDIFSLPAVTTAVLLLPTLTPTPSVISASNALDPNAPTVSPAFAALGNDIFALMLNAGFDLETSRFGGFFVMNLQTGEAITAGNSINFSGTSVMKIGILARLYASLVNPPDQRLATDIANTMICSENRATNRLLSTIGNGDEFTGADEVTTMFQTMNLTHSYIISPYVADPSNPPVSTRPLIAPATGLNQSKANPDSTNQISVDDMGYLLANMYQCAYQDKGSLLDASLFGTAYEPRECRQMLHVMSNNTVDALLKAGVPADTRVAHKHGWIGDTHSNAAIFFTPGGDYVMVMTLFQPTFLNFTESLPVFAESSRLVYNYFNPDAPMTAIRDGYIPEAASCNFENSSLVTDLRQPVWDQ